MLELKNITKDYHVGDQTVQALKGINLKFRKNEFVSILGPSGCGKTTMLNIIGGLDRYTSGDLLIENKTTKEFKDQNWDAYRNSTIGFVFQNYNLISHLTVLDNVEMALSLSGIGSKERKERSKKVLSDVGLNDQFDKKPNQLSGGQMQRVAIARALVNNPKILLADEPTGALDSKTSKQIMDVIKEISKDRLVIMVTHNSKIAEQYSDRLIKLLDGEVMSDTNSVKADEQELEEILTNKKTSMSYMQALRTSFKNLFTKKGRTMITATAGSIGIIGVALVLGISTGMTEYIGEIESDTLAGFPITISQSVVTSKFGPGGEEDPLAISSDGFLDVEEIYSYDPIAELTTHTNILDNTFIDYLEEMNPDYYTSISYTSSIDMRIIRENDNGTFEALTKSLPSTESFFGGASSYSQLPDNQEFVETQYDIITGVYPTSANEVVLIVDSENQISVDILNELGFLIEDEYTFDDILGKEYQVIPNNVYFEQNENLFLPNIDYEAMYNDEDSITITIVGIMRINEEATSEILSEGLWYTPELTEMLQTDASNSDVVAAQIASPESNILTGQAFNEQITYDSVMQFLGADTTPDGIQIYPASYESKDDIKTYIDEYNVDKVDEYQIVYTDLAEEISGTISSLITTITIILTAFAGISLIVSSIMIGIITYVSVVERTKEIGIMRSLGARKKDISRIFNAETLLIGLTSGILGVLVYYIMQTPINKIISKLIDVDSFANLPISYAIGLMLLSSVLTLTSGLIPSSIAARKDPVTALRTE
ncbi:MAG: ATP-binding cassette domain-containing protein [Candidatus Izemoplasma sp.]